MNYKDIDTIHSEILAGISDDYIKDEGYPIYDLSRGFAFGIKSVSDDVVDVANKQRVSNLTGGELDTVVEERTGLTRQQAVNATGRIQIVSGNGSLLDTDIFATETGIQFRPVNSVTVHTGDYVDIIAIEGGSLGNVAANTITEMPRTLAGISQITNPESTSGGYDIETDDSLLERYYVRLRNPVNGVNKNQYIAWANSIDGVGAARCIPIWNGVNTVKVVLLGNDKLPASPELVKKVQDYIDPNKNGDGTGMATIGAVVTVTSATSVPINITIKNLSVSKKLDTVKQDIADRLERYIKQSAFTTDYVSLAKVGAYVAETPGVEDYTEILINGAHESVEVSNDACAVLGSVVYA